MSFLLRSNNGATTVYVDDQNFRHQFVVNGSVNLARNGKNSFHTVRFGGKSVMNEPIKMCGDGCSITIDNVARWEISMALDQDEAYYSRKLVQMQELRAHLDAAISSIDRLRVGVTPIDAPVVPA